MTKKTFQYTERNSEFFQFLNLQGNTENVGAKHGIPSIYLNLLFRNPWQHHDKFFRKYLV